LGVEIELIESDLLEKISDEFEVIAANLPYIPDDSREIQKSVADFEPRLALYGGADGLDLIRKLLIQISKLPQKPKFVLLEFGGGAQTEILEKFAQEIFSDSEITILPDLAGIARVLKISRIVKTLKSNKER
jgi:release factor glutamine methyltransferase